MRKSPEHMRETARRLRNVINQGQPGWNGQAEAIVCEHFGSLNAFYRAIALWLIAKADYIEAGVVQGDGK